MNIQSEITAEHTVFHKCKYVYRLEVEFPEGFDINKINHDIDPYPMDFMLKLVDIAAIISPMFQNRIKTKAKWIDLNNPFVDR